MSKKSKRAKRQAQPSRPGTQLPPSVSIPSQIHEPWVQRAQDAQQQMFMGDFAGCIRTCEPLLTSLPGRSALRLEVLMLLGLAHGMLQQ